MQYGFDDFVLDAARLQLLRGDEPIAVEPRVLELLVYLVEHRERLVTKSELIEGPWGGQIVSDAALSRCLYQARKALGDDSNRQRFLRTVHGRGLRFAEDVEVREIDPSSDGTGGPDRAEALAAVEEARRDGEMSPAAQPKAATQVETAVGTSVVADAQALSDAEAEGRRGRPIALGLLVTALLVALLVAGLRTWSPESAGPERSAATDPEVRRAGPGPAGAPSGLDTTSDSGPTLALLPLTVGPASDGTSSEELDLLARSLTELLHIRLSAVPGLRLRSMAAAGTLAVAAGSLREAAEEMGSTHVLTGTLEAQGDDRPRVELTLYEATADAPIRTLPLGSFSLPQLREPDDFAELLRVRDALAQRTATLLDRAFADERSGPGETHDGEAWRLYVTAYQRLSDDYCGGARPALELLQGALERDPSFALAWSAIGTAHYNRVWACGENAALFDDALAAFDEALRIAPGMRHPRFQRIALLIETGRVEDAYAQILEVLEEAPDDPSARNIQSCALRYAGFLDPAVEALDMVLELDPLAFDIGTFGGSPNAYLYAGRPEDFLDAVPASEMAYHRWYRGFVQVQLGEIDAARASLEPAFRSSPNQIFGRMAHALLAVLEDDPEAAIAIVEGISRQRSAMGAADGEITLKQAQLLALAGAKDEALGELERTVEEGFFCPSCLSGDEALASLRDAPEWAEILDRARQRHRAFAARFGLDPEL